MNLRTRTSLLLLPVIALNYALSAWWIYQGEKATLIQLEKAKLEQRITALHSSISNYKSFQEAYLMSLVDGDLLAQFLLDTNNIYRSNILQRHMESSLGRFDASKEPFFSLLVLDEKNEPMLYLENSQDPFAEISDRSIAIAQKFRNSKALSNATMRLDADGSLTLYKSLAVDLRTLQAPILSQIVHSGLLIVAIEAKSVSRSLKDLQDSYRAQIYFPDQEDAETKSGGFVEDMNFVIPLGGPQAVKLRVPGDYFDEPLQDLRTRLLLLSIISCLATFLLLQYLVAKFITAPIATLDRQLDELLSERRSNISYSSSNNEVGRLARKFQSLYTRLLASFNENYQKARIDTLTGLPNRMAFNEQANELFSQFDRSKAISVCYIDVDNFKYINDKYGHEIGDRVLRQVAKGLSQSVSEYFSDRSQSSAYRLSGDEFVVLALDVSEEDIRGCGQSILALFENGLLVGEASYPVTVSLGTASTQSEQCTLSELMSNVDLAMYQAKKSGKNCIAKYSETLARQHRRMQNIELAIKSPGFEEELHLNYMPIVDRNKRLRSLEVLLRWNSPTLGMVPPDEFIPLAESIGAFSRIDLWVIEQVFINAPMLLETFPMVKYVSINISSAELNSITFVDELASLAERHEVSNGYFVLEVTETFATGNQEQVHENLSRIRSLGFRIAIDDFGTGYTSVMQMLNYPADAIKFDRSLIKRISQQQNVATAKALVELCKLQGLLVVAEGIETEEQFELLNDIGCSYQQGYFHGKPQTITTLNEWIEEQAALGESCNLVN